MSQMRISMLLVGLLTYVVCTPAHALTITIPGTATVHSAQILLGDIATIDGTQDEKTRVAAIALGSSPLAGKTQEFTTSLIGLRLRQQGIAPETVTIYSPKVIAVTRVSVEISGETIAETACAWLQQQETTADVTMKVTPTRVPRAIVVPEGDISWECRMIGTIKGKIANVQVRVKVDGQPCWRGLITMEVERLAEVLVAKKIIAAGMAVDETTMVLERRDITGVNGKALTDLTMLQGMRAANTIVPGTLLTDVMLEKIPAVLRNQAVQVRAVCGAIEVTMQAIACENGTIGDTIRVRNPKTRETYTVRIVDERAAELAL